MNAKDEREAAGSAGAETEPRRCVCGRQRAMVAGLEYCAGCGQAVCSCVLPAAQGEPPQAKQHGPNDGCGELLWEHMEAQPGFNEEMRQAEAEIAEGRGVPFWAAQGEPPQALDEALRELIRVSKNAGMNAASDFGYLLSTQQADEEEISEAVQTVYATRLSKPCPRLRHDEHCADLHWTDG